MTSDRSASPPVTTPYASVYEVYIGIGSNLNSPLDQVRASCDALKREPSFEFVTHSPWYASKALGPAGQDDYVNGVALIKTDTPAALVLSILQRIEKAQGRVRKERWGPRTLDLDILLYGNQHIDDHDLCVPHRELCRRNFVVRPLLDINPELVLPDARTLKEILPIIGENNLRQLT